MKLRFEVDQADAFRRGIDRPKSIVSVEVNPADLPEETRSNIANHLVGIDVLQFYYHNGEIIKGYPIRELSYTSRDPKRIVAKAANIESLVEAVKANDRFIAGIEESFNHPVQFRLIERPPKNEAEFALISDQSPAQMQEVTEAVRQKRRVCFECFLQDVQRGLNKLLHANSYIVYLLPLPSNTAQGRFYCEPVFAAEFLKKQVVAHSPIIVLNEKTGRIVEAVNLFQALDIYLLSGMKPGTLIDDLSILMWERGRWVIAAPESLIEMANAVGAKAKEDASALAS